MRKDNYLSLKGHFVKEVTPLSTGILFAKEAQAGEKLAGLWKEEGGFITVPFVGMGNIPLTAYFPSLWRESLKDLSADNNYTLSGSISCYIGIGTGILHYNFYVEDVE